MELDLTFKAFIIIVCSVVGLCVLACFSLPNGKIMCQGFQAGAALSFCISILSLVFLAFYLRQRKKNWGRRKLGVRTKVSGYYGGGRLFFEVAYL